MTDASPHSRAPTPAPSRELEPTPAPRRNAIPHPPEPAAAPEHALKEHALKQWRIARGLTLVEAGRLAGVSHSCWRSWETGDKVPRRRNIDRLIAASAGALTTDMILGYAPFPANPARSAA